MMLWYSIKTPTSDYTLPCLSVDNSSEMWVFSHHCPYQTVRDITFELLDFLGVLLLDKYVWARRILPIGPYFTRLDWWRHHRTDKSTGCLWLQNQHQVINWRANSKSDFHRLLIRRYKGEYTIPFTFKLNSDHRLASRYEKLQFDYKLL